MKYKCRIITGTIILLGISAALSAQQNHNMFSLHELPESNLLNPAVPISCKWYIGLPVISSVHINYANSSFTYRQLFPSNGDGTYTADIDRVVNQMHFRNYFGTEAHIQLFALGYRSGDYSLMFSIIEKDNFPVTYPKEAALLLWGGNTQFEGKTAGFRGSGMYFNHYREYGFSVSKYTQNGAYLGARAKLLFGKLNLSTRSTNIDLFTDPTTFDLHFEGELLVHSSLPVIIDTAGGTIENARYNDNISPMQLVFNRQNPGFAIDFGLIYPLNNKTELSASLIDLGFIRWRSNLNTLEGSGNFFYDGPWGDPNVTENYMRELRNTFVDSMEMTISANKYTSILPARIIAGISYRLFDNFKLGLQGEGLYYKTKLLPSLTLSGIYNPKEHISLMASYTLQYYSLKSVGLGIVLGTGPMQFYILSDDVPGIIWPLSSRNINLRFGLNINLGCTDKIKTPASGKGQIEGNCSWAEQQLQKEIGRRKKNK